MQTRPTIGPDLRHHPASFRDPDSTVLISEDAVLRVFRDADAYAACLRALDAPFAQRAVAAGSLLGAHPLEDRSIPEGFSGGIESRRIPFVTDPREWSFEMRKDAALLTLELSREALAAGFEMKDASAFNVLFEGCHPRFIDHGSFRDSYSGHWPGYSQFGDHFVSPLLIEAHGGVASLGPASGIDGIPLTVASATNRGLGRFKKGSFSWIWRRALADRVSSRSAANTGERLASAQLPRKAVDGLLGKAAKQIDSLRSTTPSFWRDYEASALPYDDEEAVNKRALVDAWASEVEGRHSALDVGCNTGTFSAILAGHFERVIAIDNDSVAIDRLYRTGSAESWGSRVTPAVVDLAQPTPAIGWLNQERRSFLHRLGVVDLSVWLAVVHHLILTGGIPLRNILDMIGQLSRYAIIEHIAPEDPSVATMTAGRKWATVPDFAEFRSQLDERGFTVLKTENTSPTRALVLVRCLG